MKYFTKELYKLCQKTDAHLLLEKAKKAGVFSDEYFQILYKKKLSEHLANKKEMESISLDFSPIKLDPMYTKGMTEEQIREIESAIDIQQEEIKQYKFNEEESIQEFEEILSNSVERTKKTLPQEILKDIADIRVFSLDRATKDIIRRVKTYCEKNESLVNKVIEDYRIYYEGIKPRLDREIAEKMEFHDCTVKKVSTSNQAIEIYLDNSGGFTDINKVTFESCRILKQDSSLEGAWWLYDEIYLVENGYEIHVLLQNADMKLIDFIFTTQEIKFFKD